MTARDSGCATRSSKQKTPKSSALQKSGGPPIIAVSALLKLAEWWESRVNLAQGGASCPDKEVCLSPPAPCGKGSRSARPTLDAASTGKTAAGTANSGGVVARQLVPPPGKEADDECQAVLERPTSHDQVTSAKKIATKEGPPTSPLWRPSSKIRDRHWERLAIVYIRQSSPHQVLENRESRERQYALATLAQQFGWPADRVLVIDEDQGLSGKSSENRDGFQRLLTEVTLDHVGLVLGLELSRLARSCKDWHHLVEVCAVFDTLLYDQDGVYDANDSNDRLLLGMKGAMSEYELITLTQSAGAWPRQQGGARGIVPALADRLRQVAVGRSPAGTG